jgi:hypothetical protein
MDTDLLGKWIRGSGHGWGGGRARMKKINKPQNSTFLVIITSRFFI